MDARQSEIWFFIVLLCSVILVSWFVLAPYVSILALAGTLAFLFKPFYQRLLGLFHNESITAFTTVIIITLVIFIPIGYFAFRIFNEATGLYASLTSNGGVTFSSGITTFLNSHFKNVYASEIVLDIDDYVRQILSWFVQNIGSFFSGVTQIFFTVFLTLIGVFYFLKDGARIKKRLIEIVPLSPKYTEDILLESEAVGSSIIKGTLIVAIIQGVLMGIGFSLFKIPDPAFWGALVALTSIIPIIGTWLIVVPAIGYLFFTGQTLMSIILLIWGLIFVNAVYNILSPQLMQRGVHIPAYLILLSVLGGIGLFGPIGFIMGPLVMAILFSLLKIYRKLVV